MESQPRTRNEQEADAAHARTSRAGANLPQHSAFAKKGRLAEDRKRLVVDPQIRPTDPMERPQSSNADIDEIGMEVVRLVQVLLMEAETMNDRRASHRNIWAVIPVKETIRATQRLTIASGRSDRAMIAAVTFGNDESRRHRQRIERRLSIE